jgi:hypothetical protein
LSADENTRLRHLNCHHAYPKSRIPRKYRAGKSKLLGRWMVLRDVSGNAHEAFHAIFGNRTPDEQLDLLRKICDKKGVLISSVYFRYRWAFDEVFRGAFNYVAMSEILRKWDLTSIKKQRYAEKLVDLLKILNGNVMGGIALRKLRLE